jgi:hypothetical protein
VSQAELGFFPRQLLAFALIILVGVGLDDQHHAAVDLGNDRANTGHSWPIRRALTKRIAALGMSLG